MTTNTDKNIKDEIAKVGYAMPVATLPFPWGRTQIFGVYCSRFRVVQSCFEFLISLVVFYTAITNQQVAMQGITELTAHPMLYSAILSMVLITSNCCMGLYCSKQSHYSSQLVRRLVLSFLFSMFAVVLLFTVIKEPFSHLNGIALPLLISVMMIYVGRVITQRHGVSHSLAKKVLIVGDGELAIEVFNRLYTHSEGAYTLYRLQQTNGASPEQFGSELQSMISEHNISEIVLAYSDRRQKLPISVLIDCKLSGIAIRNPVEFLERESGLIHFDFLDMGWIITADGFNDDIFARFIKRVIDITAGLVLFTIAAPIIVLTSIAIKLDSSGPGPIFYRQVRVGLDGKHFKVWKFRSMYTDAEADGKAQWASENDTRVTTVGAVLRKYRLDELPQLFNVLKGEMSLVGPRPERPEFVSELSDLHVLYRDRHRVKPGLTGWAQMRFPYTASANDSIKKLQYDMYYVKNRSWLLDILILLQTVEVVLCGKGAR